MWYYEWGTLSWPTLRAGSLPKMLGMESGRHIFRGFEDWKVAEKTL